MGRGGGEAAVTSTLFIHSASTRCYLLSELISMGRLWAQQNKNTLLGVGVCMGGG